MDYWFFTIVMFSIKLHRILVCRQEIGISSQLSVEVPQACHCGDRWLGTFRGGMTGPRRLQFVMIFVMYDYARERAL